MSEAEQRRAAHTTADSASTALARDERANQDLTQAEHASGLSSPASHMQMSASAGAEEAKRAEAGSLPADNSPSGILPPASEANGYHAADALTDGARRGGSAEPRFSAASPFLHLTQHTERQQSPSESDDSTDGVSATDSAASTTQLVPSSVPTSLAEVGAASAPSPARVASTPSPGPLHARSPSAEEWHSILLSKQQSQLSVKAIHSLPSPAAVNDRKRRRGRAQRAEQSAETTVAVAEEEEGDEELASVAGRLRGRRAKREAQEEKAKEEKEDEMSVDEDAPIALPTAVLPSAPSTRADFYALLEAGDLSAPSLSSSSLLLSSLDSFSSSFHSTLTQLTSSLNSQIEQHTRSLHADWQSQQQHAQSTQEEATQQAVEAETTRWQTMAQQWAAECRSVRGELDGLRDVQAQLKSLLASHPALEGDAAADSEDKMELFTAYYREKERGMREKEKRLAAREASVREREEKVEVRVLFVQQEKKREVDEVRDKAQRQRNEWEQERAKGQRERKELREKVEEMKLERLMRESEAGKLKARVKELTETIAVMDSRMKGLGGAAAAAAGGSGGKAGLGGVVKEEGRRAEVDAAERERREKQDKYVADIEEYLRRQSAELKELRAADTSAREQLRRKEEEAGLERRRAELEERKRAEAEARGSEAEKQRAELIRQLAALRLERDGMAEQLRTAQQTRHQQPPPLLPSPPQQPHAATGTHMVHPTRLAGHTAPHGAQPTPAAAINASGMFDVDPFALVREMTLKREQEKLARDRQAAVEQQQRDERERLARLEAEQRQAMERVEAIERERREREQREQIERDELQRLAEVRAVMGAVSGMQQSGGWKSVKVHTLAERGAQPPLLPTPAAMGSLPGMPVPGSSGRVCQFFNSARGCKKSDHCDHLHVRVPGMNGAGVGMGGALAKRDEKEDGELDELPMLVR